MIALSPAVSWVIVGVLIVAFFVWFYAVIKTQRRAEHMSRRWIEERWRDAISGAGAGQVGSSERAARGGLAPASELYDQDDVDV